MIILVLAGESRVIVVTNGMRRGCCQRDCRACAWGLASLAIILTLSLYN